MADRQPDSGNRPAHQHDGAVRAGRLAVGPDADRTRAQPLVVTTSLGSAAVLFGIVQTPGLSHFFGCTPLGPLARIATTAFRGRTHGLAHCEDSTVVIATSW
jgi:hypothetical protein